MDKPDPPLRKRSAEERHRWWLDAARASPTQREFFERPSLVLADRFVENAVGWLSVPLGVVSGLVVNGLSHEVPVATEEPSVIAAASYAASLAARAGGFTAGAADPVMRAQVFLEGAHADAELRLQSHRPELEAHLRGLLESMEKRGGGLRGLSLAWLEDGLAVVRIDVDVRDALGANRLNTLAEAMSSPLAGALGGSKLMAILSNDASLRPAWAEVRLPFALLSKTAIRADLTGPEMARRMAAGSRLAQLDPQRAVTHNKGIMNGITGLALATGNDTRALEAAAHAAASASGQYRGLSQWTVDGDFLVGRLEIPLPLATVGGALTAHPGARLALQLLGEPDAPALCGIAAALGLAQNFAALFALTGEGIQKGHMKLHARREG
jgi:hydroxymethylglutaryl-CoA reductase